MQITEKQLKQLIKKIIIEQKLQGLIDKINPFKKNQLSEKDLEWLKKTPEEIYKIDRIANLKKISEQFEIRAEWFSDEYVLNKFKTYDEKSVIDMAKAFLGSGVLQSIDQIHIIDQGGTPDRFDLESDLYSNMLKCGLAARKLFLKLKNKEAMKIAINFYEAAFEMNRDLDRREKRRYEKSKLTSR